VSSRVAIVGTGQIGDAVARRLLVTGLAPVVYDTHPDATAASVAAGARAVTSLGEVGALAEVVLVCVRDDAQCTDAVTGLLPGLAPGTVVAVMATVTPDTIAALAATCRAADVDLVDAPVAGRGVASIEDATMNVLVGGPDQVIERLQPVIARFGVLVATGPVGSAAVLKLAHNVMVYVGYQSVIEALELARAAGVRDGLVEQVTRASGTLSAQSKIFLDIYERRRQGIGDAAEDQIMDISAALLDKDLGHALSVAAEHSIELPAASAVRGRGRAVYVTDRGQAVRV